MRLRALALLCCMASLGSALVLANAPAGFDVDIAASNAELRNNGARVTLAIRARGGAYGPARVRVELVDAAGAILAVGENSTTLTSQLGRISVDTFGPGITSGWTDTTVQSTRVRYAIKRTASANAPSTGIVALARIAPEAIRLTVLTQERARPGTTHSVLIVATALHSAAPVRGVKILASLTLDADENAVFEKAVVTDSRGSAKAQFQIPDLAGLDGGTIEAIGVRGAVTSSARVDLDLSEGGRSMLISTDKNLYQPGQTIHARVLVVDADRRASHSKSVRLRVEDEAGETVFARELTTSRYGVASADVVLGENAPLGDYDIEATIENEVGYDDESSARVVVSRYDLPEFSVRVASDKSFYLPGERASVTVSTRYLFGQPVPNGRVRIHEIEGNRWDDRDSPDDDTDPVAEGACAADGSFTVAIDLTRAMKDLYREDWRNYRDASFVASVTDPTTNRTERRRFDLRTSREPIHISVAGRNSVIPGHPTSFFVITSLADGTVIPCDVTVSESGPWRVSPNGTPELTWRPLATARTNRYGVARVRDVRLTGEVRARRDVLELRIEAKARDGRTGSETEPFYVSDDALVIVEPSHSVLAVGDPIEAIARTTSAAPALMVSILKDGRILSTSAVPVRDGRSTVRLPYQPEFRGRISIIAHDPTVIRYRWDGDPASGTASVLYPEQSGLEVTVKPRREMFAPGESMSAAVRVRDLSGRRADGVLAIAAVDAAVGERMTSSDRYGSGGLANLAPWMQDDGGRIGDVTLSKLMRLDPARRVADDLDLVAAALMSGRDPNIDRIEIAVQRPVQLEHAFKADFDRLRGVLESTLTDEIRSLRGLPADTASLASALARHGIVHSELADPWGTPLFTSGLVNGALRHVTVSSAGPDTLANTPDDIVVDHRADEYFKPMATRIGAAIDMFAAGSGRYVRDKVTFDEAMRAAGIDPNGLRDTWGRPYAVKFSSTGTYIRVVLVSSGPDGRPGPDRDGWSDDFEVSHSYVEFYVQRTKSLRKALDEAASREAFPTDRESWALALAAAGIKPGSLVDQFESEPTPVFARLNRFTDRVSFAKKTEFGTSRSTIRTVKTPVTEEYDEIRLVGRGPDRVAQTNDDVELARFVHIRSTQASSDLEPLPSSSVTPVATNGGGAISGTVTDAQGAIIAGASVVLSAAATGSLRATVTSGDGRYFFANLTPGVYSIKVEGAGFMTCTVESIPVYTDQTTVFDVELNVAGTGETVEVTAGDAGVQVNTENQVLATTVMAREVRSLPELKRRVPSVAAPERSQGPVTSTPRLRQYFPETVYWNPELVTDKSGRARIEFPLADSITTWQLSVLASTEDGRVGYGSADVLAFQPFFVDHDPPRVLTEGDRIGLPVVVRNYLDSAQWVDLSISPAPWFAIEGPASRRVRVDAGSPSRQIFDVKTLASVDDGAQRVTGLGEQASDAIEKPVDVHPDGEERIASTSALFSGAGVIDVQLPEGVLGSPQTTLKIYPGVMAHVVESVEGILRRPYGCGEQTISSTYPSLLLLKHASDGLSPALEAKVTKYLQEGYERLKSYRAADGGIGYWNDTPSNTALTAYALRFLLDADGIIDIDDTFVAGLRDRLLAAQQTDGRWEAARWYSSSDRLQDAMETAYIAESLARLQSVPKLATPGVADAVRRGLAYSVPVAAGMDEPYLTASIALAAMEVGDRKIADDAIAKLVATARAEGSMAYWALESNTPFCGWGLAGRVETTARVVRALAGQVRRNPVGATSAETKLLTDRATHFLLKQKDRYGVWYSTQATISVLDALLEQMSGDGTSAGGTRSATVKVDGHDLPSIALPAPDVISEPLEVDLSTFIGAGRHSIEIAASDGSRLFAQVVARHYVPWVDAGRDAAKPNRAEKRVDALRFAVEYDRLDAGVGQQVTCTVTTERIGHRGYGMLVAEIGLPPGNDVDRSSLDRAVANSGWTVCKYDVLPDRVVVYLWPRAGGVTFSFRFTTRYGIEAMAAPSSVYDYYNPESSVVLQPPRFVSVER